MNQLPPSEDPSRLVRFIEARRALPASRKRAVAVTWAALATVLFVGSLLALRFWQGKLAAAREAARASAPPPAPIEFPL